MTGSRLMARAALSAALVGVLLDVPGAARAEPASVRGPRPVPANLGMRCRVSGNRRACAPARLAQVEPAPAAAAASSTTPADSAAPDAARSGTAVPQETVQPVARVSGLSDSVRPPADRVVFRFNLGLGLDGGEPAAGPGTSLLNGSSLSMIDYADVRAYSFGDVVIGKRGLIFPGLSGYLAAQFRIDHQDRVAYAFAVPSIRDANVGLTDIADLWIRSGYAEADHVFAGPWLGPLYVRAGRQYRYGAAVAHFDGLTVGYDTPAVSFGAFAGQGVDAHGFPVAAVYPESGSLAGADLRINLYELRRVPLVLGGGFLRFAGVTHTEGTMALQWNRDISAGARLRFLNGAHARSGFQVRARVSPVTTVHLDVETRSINDWMYDLFAVSAVPVAPGAPDLRTYFSLGAPLPRHYVNLRAGTVLLDNIDLLVHTGAAIRRHTSRYEPAAHATGYIEAGSAVEVRLRRAVGVGVALLGRLYERRESELAAAADGLPDPLPGDTGAAGERSFAQGTATVRYTQGARKFSAGAELYLRSYRFNQLYRNVDPAVFETVNPDLRGGARFSAEGWAGERLRLKAEYDVSTSLALAPELRGLKSLRVMAEGRF